MIWLNENWLEVACMSLTWRFVNELELKLLERAQLKVVWLKLTWSYLTELDFKLTELTWHGVGWMKLNGGFVNKLDLKMFERMFITWNCLNELFYLNLLRWIWIESKLFKETWLEVSFMNLTWSWLVQFELSSELVLKFLECTWL